MLKTERAYRDAIEAIRILEQEEIPAEEQKWRSKGASPRTIARLIGTMHARVAELRDEVQIYESIRQGDLSMFDRVEEVGQLLIAARIQRGLTQRQLAERLGVHESQVSRDERHEYHGLTLERLAELAEALALDPVIHARLRDTGTLSSSSSGIEEGEYGSFVAGEQQATPHEDARRDANPMLAGSHAARAGIQVPPHARPAGYEPTRIPAAPYAAAAHALANVGWHAALWAPRSDVNEEPEGHAGLPRVPVVVLTKEQIAGIGGGTAGATGPEGPFVIFSNAYAHAA